MLNATGKTPCSPNIDQCGFAQPASALRISVVSRTGKLNDGMFLPSRAEEAQSDPEQALEPVEHQD